MLYLATDKSKGEKPVNPRDNSHYVFKNDEKLANFSEIAQERFKRGMDDRYYLLIFLHSILTLNSRPGNWWYFYGSLP